MSTYQPGDRVNTPLGAGTVQAFETFDDDGHHIQDTSTDNGRRVLVALDDPARYLAGTLGHAGPYMTRNEITPA